MNRHTLIYGGRNLKDFNLYVSGGGAWAKPAPDIVRTQVPGRSGDLTTFNNRYENVDITYTCGIVRNFDTNFSNLIAYLLSTTGYRKLEDSSHPGVYRMALIETGVTPSMSPNLKSGEFDIVFNCKPQTYLTSGDTQQTFTSSGTINNPTLFKSKPLLRVYGNGTFTVAGKSITITSNSGYTDIDCDIQDAFYGATNRNGNITLNSGGFPEFATGNNTVSLGSGISKIIVTPRWWRL